MCNGCKDCKCGDSIKITDLSQVVCELSAVYHDLNKLDSEVSSNLQIRVKKCIDSILGLVHKNTARQNLPVVPN